MPCGKMIIFKKDERTDLSLILQGPQIESATPEQK